MTLKEFGETVEFNIEHGIKHAILGLGAPGVGKSQIIRQIGEKYGYKVIDMRLAQMSEVEIGGLIYPNQDRTRTVWLSPDILPNVERDGEKTILLLDEITSCTKRVQVAAYQLILDRRIGQYHLPDGCYVIALGNREDDDGVYIQLASPLADRFEIHFIEPDFQSWRDDFAVPHHVHPYVIKYLTYKPSSLHTQAANPDEWIFATPRSWVCVSDILKFDADVTKPVIRHKIAGNIGEMEAAMFVDFCKKQKRMIAPEAFVNSTDAAPAEPELQYVLIDGLVSMISFVKDRKNFSELTADECKLLQAVISACFRLRGAEMTAKALGNLLAVNREVVKQAFYLTDDPAITLFIENNKEALHLT